jgi:hypothetical protein
MNIININRNVMNVNRKSKRKTPPISVKNGKTNIYCNRVDILDKAGQVVATVVYSPDKPLKCGGTIWIEAAMVSPDIMMPASEALEMCYA